MNGKIKNPLDQEWYERLVSLASETGETFERLMPPLAKLNKLRENFAESGLQKNIDLCAIHLNADKLLITKEKLESLKEEILSREANENVKDAYVNRIEELMENHLMMIASANGDMPEFIKTNKSIYGMPNPEIFGAICQFTRHDAAEWLHSNIGDSAEKVLNCVPDVQGDPDILTPDITLFKAIQKQHQGKNGYYSTLFGTDGLPKKQLINQAEGDKICQKILENLGSDYSLSYSDNGIWSVLPSVKKVMRPPDYLLTREEFIGIVGHEIGSHLLETINGGKQPLILLSSGLAGMAGYEKTNEGRALLREQIVYQSPEQYSGLPFWQYCINKHLAISLSTGLHDHKYGFSEVYRVIYLLNNFWNKKRDPEAHNSLAHDMAWHMAVRVLKGTDGQGDAYRKDIVYIEGNVKCWQLAKDTPEIILAGDLGKFNIADTPQIETLRKMEVLSDKISYNI